MRNRWWVAPAVGVALLCTLAVLLFAWIVSDLSGRGRHDLTDFDPHRVARLETAMWRSYYADRPETPRPPAPHGRPPRRNSRRRAEYERALPDLQRFYSLIRRGSSVAFPVDDVARRELEWWIVHRERARHQPGDLERALAGLQAEIYQQPEAAFADHARARAEAMALCDAGNEAGFVSERDWMRIGILLDHSWGSLRASVSGGAR